MQNNTFAKRSVAENYLYLSVQWIRDGHSFVFLRFMTGLGNFGLPINYQSDAELKPSRDLVARVFPRFKLFACYYSGHLFSSGNILLFSLAVEIANRFGLNALYDEPLSQK